MANNNFIALRYKIDRLDELIKRGEYLLSSIGKVGNIDQHDLWFTEGSSFLSINANEFNIQFNAISSKYANELLGKYQNRATYHLIQEQIEVLKLTKGYFDETLQSSLDLNSIYTSIVDKELRERCSDLLSAKSNFDRVINQATLVLEDRIRRKAMLNDLQGIQLINKALNSKLDESILKLSNNPQIHEGISQICRGIVLAFRNPTHHTIIEKYPRTDALKFCAFVDIILLMLENNK